MLRRASTKRTHETQPSRLSACERIVSRCFTTSTSVKPSMSSRPVACNSSVISERNLMQSVENILATSTEEANANSRKSIPVDTPWNASLQDKRDKIWTRLIGILGSFSNPLMIYPTGINRGASASFFSRRYSSATSVKTASINFAMVEDLAFSITPRTSEFTRILRIMAYTSSSDTSSSSSDSNMDMKMLDSLWLSPFKRFWAILTIIWCFASLSEICWNNFNSLRMFSTL